MFEAVVQAVTVVMWARDCNIICAPANDSMAPHHAAVARIAREVAARCGMALFSYGGADEQPSSPSAIWQLDISPELPANSDAIAARDAIGAGERQTRGSHERFVQPIPCDA